MELIPVFSPTDCASAGAAIRRHAVAIIVRLMGLSSPINVGQKVDHRLRGSEVLELPRRRLLRQCGVGTTSPRPDLTRIGRSSGAARAPCWGGSYEEFCRRRVRARGD